MSALIAADEQMVRRLIGEDIQLITHLEPSLDLVRADAGQLRQVLLNLVVNAWDAMPNGGTLTISTSNRELGDKEANRSGASPGRYVELTVADTGSGMTKEVQSHLFEPFYTTKEQGKGTGLGLSTVFGIVRKHGGHIDVKSKPGKGTRFKILLPGLPAEPAASPERARLDSRSPGERFAQQPHQLGKLVRLTDKTFELRRVERRGRCLAAIGCGEDDFGFGTNP